ncbi:MAG: translocation/assembly module TamB [Muribaculaceae bacterium]|nr:translocation/assembly module TamB [Muribaculaceae bacterium]
MKLHRKIYRVARSVLFTAVLAVVGIYLGIYVLLSVPAVQNRIKGIAVKEISAFLGSEVKIDNLVVKPFNEVVVKGLSVNDLSGRECLYVETVGVGVSLWKLLSEGKVEFSYGEIIGLRADVSQPAEGAPLNIAFIIDAFKPKDKNKPPTKFDIKLRNVVLRRCSATFNREWQPLKQQPGTDFNHLNISDLKADLNIPRLKNDDFIIDLRRLAFKMSGGFNMEKLALQTHITSTSISVNNLVVELPGTKILPSDFSLNFKDFNHIVESLQKGNHQFVMIDNRVTPSDFACFWQPLHYLHNPITLTLETSGNMHDVRIERLNLDEEGGIQVSMQGELSNSGNFNESVFSINHFLVELAGSGSEGWLALIPEKGLKAKDFIRRSIPLSIDLEGTGEIAKGDYSGELEVGTANGDLRIEAQTRHLTPRGGEVKAHIYTDGFDLGKLLVRNDLGLIKTEADFEGVWRGKDVDGKTEIEIKEALYKGVDVGGINLSAQKQGKNLQADIEMDNYIGRGNLSGDIHLDGKESVWKIEGVMADFSPSMLGFMTNYRDYRINAALNAELNGNNPDNMVGKIEVNDFNFYSSGGKSLSLNRLCAYSIKEDRESEIKLACDWLDMELIGEYSLTSLPGVAQGILHSVFPSLVSPNKNSLAGENTYTEFSMLLHPDNGWTEFLNLPVRLLVPVAVSGRLDGEASTLKTEIDIPYLQQGKNKLLRGSHLVAEADGVRGSFNVDIASIFPTKKGDTDLNLRLWGERDNVLADIDWNTPESPNFKGRVSLDGKVSRNDMARKPEVSVKVKPSIFEAGSARWNIGESEIIYKEKTVEIDPLRIWHDNQFLEIAGRVSESSDDSLHISLADIDLGYIFDTLNINYVTFGGVATGALTGSRLMSKTPVMSTEKLFIKDLSYNGALLGDGDIRSRWMNDDKKIEILADIRKGGKMTAKVDGGIWIGRDSLSFGIDADRVPVDFLAPFMSAFSSEVKGYASGSAKLFGTFSDIDLAGDIYADSLSMKLDFTNTYYHGSDSVFLRPGKIEIPSFRLYDKDGNSALLTGQLTHRYFHDPRFSFRLSDARNLLCYDTNSSLNPDWYGTVYGSGGALVRGWPGVVSVSVDMSVVGPSSFTFVLNETEAAGDYNFLTFTDKRKQKEMKERKDSVEDILARFRKQMNTQDAPPSNFILDLRASVTPSSLFTLVMDPAAGDKITARGAGALQMGYETKNDEFQMFGKYTLEEGNYNFSLQDLILKDFVIKQGSSISFNGDPMNALLDITASYRVNTNLSDLDKSFSTDRELNRTNVPVDALLMVKGEMQHPDITFDIELPTLTQDVERKVKSIISTDDMMSRQIIYLLALNRFYTPEYMGTSSNGGELAAVASSTLSSQLTNIIGQMTDKFTLAPSIRSDKGDFSDVEFDVALSSRLLNNRLLINGNFGYRDRNTSTTTFVGDFDIEYLLNRSGNLRLKAYNHFNDQNYYLREALTTQGLGIIFRKDFDDAFKWLRRRKKSEDENKSDKNGKNPAE